MVRTSTAMEVVETLREVVVLSRLANRPTGATTALHSTQAAVLGLLAADGEQRLGRLACELDLDASVVSRRVSALEEAGLVRRRVDPEDARALLVGLTDPGRDALLRHREERAAQVAEALAHRRDADVARIVGELRGLLADLHHLPVRSR